MVRRLEVACEETVGVKYVWGQSDCFAILNQVYKKVGLPLMDSDGLYNYLGNLDHHPTRDEMDEVLRILDTVNVSSEERLGTVAIITANGLGFGTMIRFQTMSFITTPGGFSRMTENRCINRVVRIESYTVPSSHLVK